MRDTWEGTWTVVRYLSGDDMVTPAEDGPQPEITFEAASVFGSMGINRFSGRVGPEGVIEPMATTRMAGPEYLMEQEDTLLRHLTDADTIVADGEGMTLTRDGLKLVELWRSGTNEPGVSS